MCEHHTPLSDCADVKFFWVYAGHICLKVVFCSEFYTATMQSAYRINGYNSICRRTETVQIRLHGCARSSGPSLFAYGIRAVLPRCVSYNKTTITKTRLYNFDPPKPHFYIVKRGFTGVYIIFLFSAQNINCEYSLEPPRRGGSNEYPQSMF